MTSSPASALPLATLLDLVRRRFPDWDGFAHPAWQKAERAPKRLAVLHARDDLSDAELSQLLHEERYDEFLRRLERAGSATNLLWRRVPSQGDLGILQHPRLELPAFCVAIRDLLHGAQGETAPVSQEPDAAIATRLEAFLRFLSAHDLPRKWTFSTYFLWLTHPQSELFVQPATWKWLLALMKEGETWRAQPSVELYVELRALAHQLRTALQAYGAEDMADVQSLVRVAHAMSRRETRRESQLRVMAGLSGYALSQKVPVPSLEGAAPVEGTRIPLSAPPLSPPPTLDEIAAETSLPLRVLRDWEASIEHKGAAIFQGPPGVGKTFLAGKLAHYLAGENGLCERVQFHPAYAYEDWIQGLRPARASDGTLTYELAAGRFLEFCQRARVQTGRCVLIVEEINRADVGRVFGELLTALEYRDIDVPLASGGALNVPANVRLIGTMNTADRALSPLDAALRRRFALLPMEPNYEAVCRYSEGATLNRPALVRVLQRINAALGDPQRLLGTSYFLRPFGPDQLGSVWRYEVEPALEELFWDEPQRVEEFRWEQVRGELTRSSEAVTEAASLTEAAPFIATDSP